MNLVPLAAALAAWQPLPAVADRGYGDVDGVRTGHTVVFVAGAGYDATRVKALAFDLRTRRWRRLPPVPLHWRSQHVTVAAGRKVIVWGGASNTGLRRDGAVFDGTRWRRMPPAPVHDDAAVWTGREMIAPAGAAYDPATNRWRRIRPAPFATRTAVWTGSRVLVVEVYEAAAYDPSRNRWRRIAPPPIGAWNTPRLAWTGTRLLAFNGGRGAIYDPARDRWHRIPRPPLTYRSEFTAVWDGAAFLTWGPRGGAAFSPAERRWRRLPPAPLAPRDRHAAVALPAGGMIVWAGCCAPHSRQHADGAILRLSRRSPRAAAAGPPRRAGRGRCPGARARP